MNEIEQLLEAITESIRRTRRYGLQKAPKFPTPFDLSHISYDADTHEILMDLVVDGKKKKYSLVLEEVNAEVLELEFEL